MAGQSNSEKDWPGGWLVAVVAGVITAILARWIGDVGMAPAVLVGVFVFLVFGVILGMFWTVPASGGHDDHGHDHSGHDDHGHDDHGHSDHASAAAPPAAEPVAAAPAPAVVAPPAPVAVAPPVPVAVAPPAPAVVAPPAPVAVASPVPAAVVDPAPAMAVEPAGADAGVATKPAGLAGPRGGQGDDLQTLEGIGPVMERLCHELGFFHFDQIAAWGAAEVAWMDANLKGFKGRVSRDKWVRQARLIGEVGLDEFKRRAKSNDY